MEPGQYPFSTNKSSSQQKITELWIRALECWNTQWRKRFIFRFPQIGRISLDNRTNIYLSDSKWESTKVLGGDCTETLQHISHAVSF